MSGEKRIVGWVVKYPDGSYDGVTDWRVEKAARAVYTNRADAIDSLSDARRYDQDGGVLVRITRRKKAEPPPPLPDPIREIGQDLPVDYIEAKPAAEIPEPRVGMRVEWTGKASEFGGPKLRGPRAITKIEDGLIFALRADGYEASMMFTSDWANKIHSGELRILPDEVEVPEPKVGMRVEWTEEAAIGAEYCGPRTITKIEDGCIFAPSADGRESPMVLASDWASEIRNGHLRILPDEAEVPEPKVGMRVEWTEKAGVPPECRGPRVITRIDYGSIFASCANSREWFITFKLAWANEIRAGRLRILPDTDASMLPAPRMVALDEVLRVIDKRIAKARQAEEVGVRDGVYLAARDSQMRRHAAEDVRADVLKLAKAAP